MPVCGVYPGYVTVSPIQYRVLVCCMCCTPVSTPQSAVVSAVSVSTLSIYIYVYGRVGRVNGPGVPGGGALCVVSSPPPVVVLCVAGQGSAMGGWPLAVCYLPLKGQSRFGCQVLSTGVYPGVCGVDSPGQMANVAPA